MIPAQATVRDNVLFGRPLDRAKYAETLRRCALEADMEALADGDQTEIGEKGLTLSGGQKQRVALARAYYADADLYLLDDCLSAVDAHVAQHLFDHLILHLRDVLKRTVVLVTHNLFLGRAGLPRRRRGYWDSWIVSHLPRRRRG